MKKTLFALFITVPMLFASAAQARNTVGIGTGSMYNGIGINFGISTQQSLTFGAVGCVGGSVSSSDTVNDDSNDSNGICGLGFGRISTSAFSNNHHGLGLSVALNYNTDEDIQFESGIQWTLTPSYHYFFSGIDRRGLNIGIGPTVILKDGQPTDTVGMINLGFQF